MHGTIHAQLQRFVEEKHGRELWERILEESGIGAKIYTPFEAYPDEDAVKIVVAAARLAATTPDAVLQAFGEFIAPALLDMYKALIRPEWKTLDVIEHTEETIHRVVRLKNPGAKPPELVAKRKGPDEVVVTYTSARRMCGVAKGIARGVARRYAESVTVTDFSCMNHGAAACVISVRRVG